MTADLAAVEAALRRIFPDDVALAAEHVVQGGPQDLWPEEEAAACGAVPQRLAEFAAGRRAARRVLAALGRPPAALPMAQDRAAVWPSDLCGSIAHAARIAVAVARPGPPLGVDLEPDLAVDPDLWPTLCSPAELSRLSGDTGRLVRRIFCAKEAVFKAQDPDRRAMFGFDAVDVTLAEAGFDAQFRFDAGGFRAGQVLSGRLETAGNVILAGVSW